MGFYIFLLIRITHENTEAAELLMCQGRKESFLIG